MKPAPPVTREFMRRRTLATVLGATFAPRMRGLFVTFEGIDRSGKTTQARLLCEALGDEALGVREPGGTTAGERVRAILKDPAVRLSPEGEALLFAAARAELVTEVILPAFALGPRRRVRPLPRLLARLPGRGARARDRRRRAGQQLCDARPAT